MPLETMMAVALALVDPTQVPAPVDGSGRSTGNGVNEFISIAQLAQFGFVGFVLGCLVLKRFVVPKWVLDEKDAEIVKLQESLDTKDAIIARQTEVLEKEAIPALVRATDQSARVTQTLANLEARGRG